MHFGDRSCENTGINLARIATSKLYPDQLGGIWLYEGKDFSPQWTSNNLSAESAVDISD